MTTGEVRTQASVVAPARQMATAGDPHGALSYLRQHCRRAAMPPHEVRSAGKLLTKLLPALASESPALQVLLLGQCTTNWLAQAITTKAFAADLPCVLTDGPFDNVLQALTELCGPSVPDVLILLPWNERLLGGDADDDQIVADELHYWLQAWQLAKVKGISRLIQIGYDWVHPGAMGHHLGAKTRGDVSLVRQMNAALRQALPEGAFMVELEDVSGTMGRKSFYDARNLHWTRQPFSEAGVVLLADQIAAGIRALITGPCKVLVLDLDNTLWGGVVGEVGPHGIDLAGNPRGEAFRAFQRHVKALAKQGVVLAVSTKNNEADAREPFLSNPDMVLRLDDFASFIASWDAKPESLRRIAGELGLGLDSFVFFDDSPFERDMVRQALPQVHVVETPEDPAEYIAALQSGMWFETLALTNEDRQRSQHYQAESQRRSLQAGSSNLDEYLASLAMTARAGCADEPDLERVIQLLAKTNQFNLTTRRHSANTVRSMMADPKAVCLTLRLSDRFGDHGLVALVLAIPAADPMLPALHIDSFLMSCRVIGRTVESCLMQLLVQRAGELGYAHLSGEYIATPKNKLVEGFYERMGFERCVGGIDGGTVRYDLRLPTSAIPGSHVRIRA